MLKSFFAACWLIKLRSQLCLFFCLFLCLFTQASWLVAQGLPDSPHDALSLGPQAELPLSGLPLFGLQLSGLQLSGLPLPVVPDSLNGFQHRWMQILSAPAPSIDEERMSCEQLVTQLRLIGLPVVLDQTALDDSLSQEEMIALPCPAQPLLGRLLLALNEKNSTLFFDTSFVRVISIDNAEDPEFRMLVTYDLTGSADAEVLGQACQIVDPDGEILNESTVAFLRIKGRSLMAVNASFEMHLKLRQFFQSVAIHTGSFVDAASHRFSPLASMVIGKERHVSNAARNEGSVPVALPEKKVKAGINLSRGNNFGGRGGMSGGVFRVGQ